MGCQITLLPSFAKELVYNNVFFLNFISKIKFGHINSTVLVYSQLSPMINVLFHA